MIAMIATAIVLALLPRTRLTMVALFCVGGAAAYDASVLWAYTSIVGNQQITAGSCSEGNRLRLLEVNVQMTNRHDHTLLNIIRQVNPDVAWVQETNDWWTNELSAFKDQMPYHVSKAQPNYFGADLYSRFPLIDPQINYLTESKDPAIFTGVRLPSGQTIKLYAIHPRPPVAGRHGTAERDGQILATALAAHDERLPHVVAGDLNSVPWEDVIQHAQRVGRFLNPRIGRGLYITWDAENPIAKWPLDHILPDPGFTLLSLKVLPAFGSDHHPYFADLCVDPSAASRQSVPALQDGDIASARKAVMRGQGKADQSGSAGGNASENNSSGSREGLVVTERGRSSVSSRNSIAQTRPDAGTALSARPSSP